MSIVATIGHHRATYTMRAVQVGEWLASREVTNTPTHPSQRLDVPTSEHSNPTHAALVARHRVLVSVLDVLVDHHGRMHAHLATWVDGHTHPTLIAPEPYTAAWTPGVEAVTRAAVEAADALADWSAHQWSSIGVGIEDLGERDDWVLGRMEPVAALLADVASQSRWAIRRWGMEGPEPAVCPECHKRPPGPYADGTCRACYQRRRRQRARQATNDRMDETA